MDITVEVTERQDGGSWVNLLVYLDKGGQQYPIGGKTWSLDALAREGLSIGALEPLCACKTLNELIARGDEMSMDFRHLLGTDAFITSSQVASTHTANAKHSPVKAGGMVLYELQSLHYENSKPYNQN